MSLQLTALSATRDRAGGTVQMGLFSGVIWILGPHSICDALLAPMPGALMFPIDKAPLAVGLTVTDDQVGSA